MKKEINIAAKLHVHTDCCTKLQHKFTYAIKIDLKEMFKINLLFYFLPNMEKSRWKTVWHHIPTGPVKSVFFTASGTARQQLKASQWRAAEAEASWESSNIFSAQSGLYSFKEAGGKISLPGFGVAHRCSQPVTSHLNSQLLAVSGAVCGY